VDFAMTQEPLSKKEERTKRIVALIMLLFGLFYAYCTCSVLYSFFTNDTTGLSYREMKAFNSLLPLAGTCSVGALISFYCFFDLMEIIKFRDSKYATLIQRFNLAAISLVVIMLMFPFVFLYFYAPETYHLKP
jgi:hypothetical protein